MRLTSRSNNDTQDPIPKDGGAHPANLNLGTSLWGFEINIHRQYVAQQGTG